jgi:dephospho-CoA kinase
MNEDFKVIAITGGIGSGKSTVAKFFADKGFPVINTDFLAKDLMNFNSEVKEKLISHFGEQIYNSENLINNKVLSELVFSDIDKSSDNLAKLNQIVHPCVIEEMMERIEDFALQGEKIIFVESALIYEAELEDGFDYIIVVDAPEEMRIKWAKEKMKLSEEQIRNRISGQISTEVKKNLADFVIQNNGTIPEMLASAEFVLDLIKLA